jgi:uncharacterized protein (DUF2062 family)
MLFRRRNPQPVSERLKTWFWPRRSFGRSLKYFAKRILRLRGTPHAVAAGVAVGVFIAFLPIPGIHLVIAAVLSWLVAGNVVASAFGTTVVGNPLTWPAIWAATYALGRFVLGTRAHAATPHFEHMLHHMRLSQLWHPLLEPMLIGAVPLGLVAALLSYGLTRWGVDVFNRQRQARLARRAQQGRVASPARL